MCCKTRLGKKRLRGEGHDGGGGLFAVNVLASDLKLQAAVSRASQGRRQESIICIIHPE